MANSSPIANSQFKFHVWPTDYRHVTQHFGVNPHNYAQFGLPGHDGVDIRAPRGSKVYCVAPGEVTRVHTDAGSHNYGIHVRIAHQHGYRTIYAHLQKASVKVGDVVEAGTVLGLADNTGNSFGSHLHLTLKKTGARQGEWPYNIIDPTPFLLPLLGWQKPTGPYIGGWVLSVGITVFEGLAQANRDGVTLYAGPDQRFHVPEGTIMLVTQASTQGFTPVQVPKAAVGLDDDDLPSMPAPEPPPTVTTVDGWAWSERLQVVRGQAIVKARYGINLRIEPNQNAQNIGVVSAGSTVSVLGEARNQYLPVRVRRVDFVGPVNWPTKPPPLPDGSLSDLSDGVYLGWVQTQFLQLNGAYAHTRHRGVQMRSRPDTTAEIMGMVKGDATVTLAGLARGTFTPVLVNEEDVLWVMASPPDVVLPQPFPPQQHPSPPAANVIPNTKAGWVLTADITVEGDEAVAGPQGLNLRDGPRRDAKKIGFIPALATLRVMGSPRGEFTPVRVEETLLQPPVYDSGRDPNEVSHNPDPGLVGRARIGLHASADPEISQAEHEEFAHMRPGIIKVLSFHSADDIARLAHAHPHASWIVRAFLDMDGRQISPEQFVNHTLPDVSRALQQLPGKDVVVELHNEPNLVAEGLGSSWSDGASFNDWWLQLLDQYRQALPGARFIYPGLSPGTTVSGTKIDHIQFISASREAVAAADGLGVHLYWSNVYPMSRALDVLDDLIGRFRFKPIWITEASHNRNGLSAAEKARQYLQFWQALQQRPVVQGVTFFVASASNPDFAEEVWVGRGIGKLIGRR